ncbi:MAG: 2-oxo acid dehydrogenase subunit E2, partial [Anaerolineae bacterium]|nr:2-oxo acid dehydrogenase subunit E2 [Anaerolineae bacterium]
PEIQVEPPSDDKGQSHPQMKIGYPVPPPQPYGGYLAASSVRHQPASDGGSKTIQGAGELVPLTAMRRTIAEHMVRSKLQTAPHVTTVFEFDMSAVMAHREANKETFAKQGVNLTLTAYFAVATAEALQSKRYLNAQWTDEGIFLHNVVNLGMAVAMDDGLIVPVIKNASDLNLIGMARAVNDLAGRARAKQLKSDDVQGGTFTITNHGVSGSLLATPIINQPQSGILGVGMMEKRVKVINDMIAIRPCCYVTLTFDHRVADGATGDGFMQQLKDRVENWQ